MSIIEVRVGGRFKIKRNTGSGTFGEIYIAQNVQTKDEVAVKLEDTKAKYPQLIYEAKILYSLQGGTGIPNLIWCGQEGDYNILIMELLGNSLEQQFNLCGQRFSLKTVLMIVDQALQLIEHIHNKGFLHRDIKPENLLIGLDATSHLVHFIDFGLAKRYRDPKTGAHIPYRVGKQLTGTARYASINTHQGIEQSRRDDLEAIGYMFVYLFKGGLPWQGLKSFPGQEKYGAIYEKKINTTIEDLCSGMPREFVQYFDYCRKLHFEEKPDYTYLRRMFKELFIREGHEFDYVYDWVLIPMSQQISVDTERVSFDVEFDINDEFVNKNLFDIDKRQGQDGVYKENKDVPNQEQNTEEVKEVGKGVDALSGKNKPKIRPIETEYLRTDYRLANMPSPTGLKSPNSTAAIAQKLKKVEVAPVNQGKSQGRPVKEAEKGKDCNMF